LKELNQALKLMTGRELRGSHGNHSHRITFKEGCEQAAAIKDPIPKREKGFKEKLTFRKKPCPQ
jgi:hypothetical protein